MAVERDSTTSWSAVGSLTNKTFCPLLTSTPSYMFAGSLLAISLAVGISCSILVILGVSGVLGAGALFPLLISLYLLI